MEQLLEPQNSLDESSASIVAQCRRCRFDLQAEWAFCGECGLAVGKKERRSVVHLPEIASRRHESAAAYGEQMRRPQKKLDKNRRHASCLEQSSTGRAPALTKDMEASSSSRRRRFRRQTQTEEVPDPHLEAAAALLSKQKNALEAAVARRAKQERVITLLESSNVVQRNEAIAKPNLLLRNPTHVAVIDPRGFQRPPTPPQEPSPRPMRFQEWHLKTVHGIHDFPNAVRKAVEQSALILEVEKQGQLEQQTRRLENEGQVDETGEQQYLSSSSFHSSSSSLASSSGVKWPLNKSRSCGGSSSRHGSSSRGGSNRSGIRSAATPPTTRTVATAASAQGLLWGSEEGEEISSNLSVASLNPIRVAPGTPLTGPQSLPTTLTNFVAGATQQQLLEVDMKRLKSRAGLKAAGVHSTITSTTSTAATRWNSSSSRSNKTKSRQDGTRAVVGDEEETDDGVNNNGARQQGMETEEEEVLGGEVKSAWFWGSKTTSEKEAEEKEDEDGGGSRPGTGQSYGSAGGWGEEATAGESHAVTDSTGRGGDGHGGRLNAQSCGIFWRGDESAEALYKSREEAVAEGEKEERRRQVKEKEQEGGQARAANSPLPTGPQQLPHSLELRLSALQGKKPVDNAAGSAVVAAGGVVIGESGEEENDDEGGHGGAPSPSSSSSSSFSTAGGGEDEEDQPESERAIGVLHNVTMQLLSRQAATQCIKELRTLKKSILECYRVEQEMAALLEVQTKDMDERKSRATLAVADSQFKVSNEHAKVVIVKSL